jgi:DNA-binding NarL/FixJ family response regulator
MNARFARLPSPQDTGLPLDSAAQYQGAEKVQANTRTASPEHAHERAPVYPDENVEVDPFAAVLDEVDYGMIMLSAGLRVRHCNHAARLALRDGQVLRLVEGTVAALQAASHQRLQAAVQAALQPATGYPRRCMITLIHGQDRMTVSVVPLAQVWARSDPLVLLVLSKREICSRLCAERQAREYGLTAAETSVLCALVEGLEPREIAARNDVKLSTVRTQVQSIFVKLGIHGMRDLFLRVATLPPLVSTLRF